MAAVTFFYFHPLPQEKSFFCAIILLFPLQPPNSQYPQYTVPAHLINYGVGQPATNLLPLQQVRQAAAARFAEEDPLLLQYGVIPGYRNVRVTLVRARDLKCAHCFFWEAWIRSDLFRISSTRRCNVGGGYYPGWESS